MFTISICSSTVQLLEETPAVLSHGKLCSEHGCSYDWKKRWNSTIDQKWLDNYLYKRSSSSSSSASTSRSKDQSNDSRKLGTSWDPVTTRSDKHACGKPMLTDPDKLASGNRGPAHKEDEMDEEDPTQDIPDWLLRFTENLEDLETHVPAHPSEREISDSEGDASKVETQKKEAQCSCLLPWRPNRCLRIENYEGSLQKTRWGIHSTSRKVWWLDNSGSQSPQRRKWIPEQSPKRCKSHPCKNKNSLLVKTRIRRRRSRVYENF